ncbi:DMT family transporter [Microbacterium sp. YY-01]|uniref:DMT family transporter n=1 Tax=Microbacterium sp. YY-01 TaxID=3421634 RepID=UPI003D17FD02
MSRDRPAIPAAIAVAAAVSIGVMTAIQARINGLLGARLDDGILAGFISFFVGLVIILVVLPFLPKPRAGVSRLWQGLPWRTRANRHRASDSKTSRIPFWMLLGGTCGALTVTTQGLVAGVVGVALFTVGVVAGQTLHSLLLDRMGFGPAGVVPVTVGRVVGGALALAAVVISLSGDVFASSPLWMLLLPFAAGVGIAWQAGANGRLAQRVRSPMAATLVSFIAGTTVLAIAAVISVAVAGMPRALPTEPWLYLGGLLGFIYILLGAFIVAHTGVLVLSLGSVLGQLVTSVVIDLVWRPAAGPSVTQMVIMVAFAIASVLAAVPWRRRRARPEGD